MKKAIILVILLSGIAFTVFFLLKTNRKYVKRKADYAKIPSFCLQSIDNDTVTEQMLQKNISTLFVFFEPGCDLCDTEIKEINLRKNEFSAFQIVFFTLQMPETIRAYLEEIDFFPDKNMFFLADENAELYTVMEVKSSPSVFIYNSEGVLIKQFSGPVQTETLLKYLSEK